MNMETELQMKNNKEGGNVLASGGFGCVFSPALKCIGKNKRDEGKISKLMTNNHAKEEYDEIKNINSKLNKIHKYKDYFLIDDFSLCKPSKLTQSDLKNYRECDALIKESITAKTINNSLDKLLAINMPYGGITVENFVTNSNNYSKLMDTNNKLIDLLKNGILKMNQKHIYHSDIKGSNILILTHAHEKNQSIDMKVRLIDWSLTVEYIPFKNSIFPINWKNRPLQFNVPFSIILFTDMFVDSYSEFLESNSYVNSLSKRKMLFKFVKNYLHLWMKKRGPGHYKYINKIMYMLFKYDLVSTKHNNKNSDNNDEIKRYIEINYTLPYIINYLVEILFHFTKFRDDGSLDIRYYLDNYFIKIIDIWGFIISYFPLYELLFENYHNLNTTQMMLLNKLKHIFINYLYSPQIHLIKLKNLENDLKDLNNFFKIQKKI